jgi:hypothetical protein
MIRDMPSFLLGLVQSSAVTAALIALAITVFVDCAEARSRDQRAVDAALTHWGRTPDCGRPRVQWRNPPPELMDPWPPQAWAVIDECVAAIRGDYHGPYWHLCALVAHEVGHLLGHGHTRRGLMSPYVTPPRNCRRHKERTWSLAATRPRSARS